MLISLVNSKGAVLIADDPVIDAQDIQAFSSAAEQAQSLNTLYAQAQTRMAMAEQQSHERGFEQGRNEGRKLADEALAEKALAMVAAFDQERDEWRRKAMADALNIVRRIASSIGTADTLTALALDAAAELMPNDSIVLEVHSDVLEAVKARIAHLLEAGTNEIEQSRLQVMAVRSDDAVAPDQVVLRAGPAMLIAGLETQLSAIERQLQSHSPELTPVRKVDFESDRSVIGGTS